jgi:hypothetical protein
VLVVTDDQRWDTLEAMPAVTFPEAFVVNPLCCPSRTSILTGRYSHSTGVYRQSPPFGGSEAFDDSSTLATWLDDADYRDVTPIGHVPDRSSPWLPLAMGSTLAVAGLGMVLGRRRQRRRASAPSSPADSTPTMVP